jgi:hypothetical protein
VRSGRGRIREYVYNRHWMVILSSIMTIIISLSLLSFLYQTSLPPTLKNNIQMLIKNLLLREATNKTIAYK